MLGVILTLSIVPDAFLLWLLLPHSLWWLALLFDVLEVWTCIWIFGLYGSMVLHPHELTPERVTFHSGLNSVQVEPQSIAAARCLGLVRSRDLPRRRGDGSRVLTFGGVPVVEVALTSGIKLFVASDCPQALCDMLCAAR